MVTSIVVSQIEDVKMAKLEIKNITKNEIYKSEPFPEFIKNIINSNGLLNSIKNG